VALAGHLMQRKSKLVWYCTRMRRWVNFEVFYRKHLPSDTIIISHTLPQYVRALSPGTGGTIYDPKVSPIDSYWTKVSSASVFICFKRLVYFKFLLSIEIRMRISRTVSPFFFFLSQN
jgi:hypothetical protein